MSVDVSTGNLIEISDDCKTLFTSIDRGETFKLIPTIKNFQIKKENYLVDNLKVNQSTNEMYELNASTLSQMKLNRDQAWVVWVICDSLTVFCDRSKTSSLVLGTKFDIGLNFMNILNKRVHHYQIVNDMMSLFLERTFRLDSLHDLESLVNSYVKSKYMDLLIMFETDGKIMGKRKRNSQMHHTKRLTDFLDDMENELDKIEYVLEGLVGKNQLNKWTDKFYKLLDQRMDKKTDNKSNRKKSFELHDGNYRINENFKLYLNMSHKIMPNFYIDKKGFQLWKDDLYRYNCSMLKTIIRCVPNRKFISIERNTIKLFVLYLTKKGKKAVKDYIKENPQIINFIVKRKKKIMKFIWSDRDACYKFRFFTRFSVNDVYKVKQSSKEGVSNKKEEVQDIQPENNEDEKLSKRKKSIKLKKKYVMVETDKKEAESQDTIRDANILLFHTYASILKKWHSSLLLRPSLSRSYSIDTISDKLCHFESSRTNSTSSKKNLEISVSNLINYVGGKGICWPPLNSTPNSHNLGDRVININPESSDIVFGVVGTIIAQFKDQVEVLLDDPVIGATDLKGRVPPFRGKTFKNLDLFNLSQWRKLVISNHHLGKSKKIWKGEMNSKNLIDHIRNDFTKVKRRN